VQKTVQGAIEMGMSSTQNASSLIPWLNALDWPFMFQNTGQMYHFLFNPKSEQLFRKIYREKYRLEFLWAMCEPRHLFMGLKWKDREPVKSVKELKGAKVRVTNTTMGRIALELMETNPVPVAWVETLDALKSGLIDGAETSAAPAAAFNMAPVLSRVVVLGFIPLIEHHAINTRVLDKLGSDLRDEVMEAAYQAQRSTLYSNEAGQRMILGMEANPSKDTIFGSQNVSVDVLSKEAVDEAEKMCHPSNKAYDEIRNTLNGIAGFDVYEAFLPVAREYSRDGLSINVQPRRWWKSA
ncbi:MAG: TRAP transporter substrate-binding protein, partial [Hyphomicrobiales bacterium]